MPGVSDYQTDVPLAPLTTLRVGGPAAVYIEVEERFDLIETVRDVWSTGGPWMVLGGGSNLVIADEGFPGVVVAVRTRGIDVLSADEFSVLVRVQAGETWDDLVAFTVLNGLAGIEALSGIPGSVGAAPIQNIGAYGQEVGDVLVSVEFLDERTGSVIHLSHDELELGYRTSAFKRGRRGVVLSVDLQLEREGTGPDAPGMPIRYAQLASALGVPLGGVASLGDTRSAVLTLRSGKGMVLDPADPDSVSAGSFFTNPIVPETFALQLPTDAPRWAVSEEPPPEVQPLSELAIEASDLDPTPDGPTRRDPFLVKLSAAWLIEHAGISRGFTLPGSRAGVSTKHTLALVNRGGATASEIQELSRFIQARVHAAFGVTLHPEPIHVGFAADVE